MGFLMLELSIDTVMAFIGGTIVSTIITMAIGDFDKIKLIIKKR